MQITKVDGTSNRFFFKNNGQITIFTSAKLTLDGNLIISRNGEPISLLGERIVEEATQLMIDNGILISKESENVGAL
jgi:hypothetical protein